MVDAVPVLLLLFGVISLFKPHWMAAVHRRQKAAGTTNRPRDIEVTEGWIAFTRLAGLAFVLVGAVLTLGSF